MEPIECQENIRNAFHQSTEKMILLTCCVVHMKNVPGVNMFSGSIRSDCRTRKNVRLLIVILSSCMAGLLIGMYSDAVAVASTVKRLTGNQFMTLVYRTDMAPDQTRPLARTNHSRRYSITPTRRTVSNGHLDQIALSLDFYGNPPLLTLFTTFKNARSKFQIHKNILYNWAAFKPHVLPVLFDTNSDPDLIEIALKLGWKVINYREKSIHGVPFLKPMFEKVETDFNSTFYGYSNADVLFDNGLINTLIACEKVLPLLGQTLVIGQRHNFDSENETLYKPSEVADTAKVRGKLFRNDAEDYFIINKGAFSWNNIKQVVVGRPGYDNYLVSFAIQNGLSVVDATKTLLALHQSGKDGNRAGFFNRDSGYNYREIGVYNYDGGYTSHAQLETRPSSTQDIDIWRRN